MLKLPSKRTLGIIASTLTFAAGIVFLALKDLGWGPFARANSFSLLSLDQAIRERTVLLFISNRWSLSAKISERHVLESARVQALAKARKIDVIKAEVLEGNSDADRLAQKLQCEVPLGYAIFPRANLNEPTVLCPLITEKELLTWLQKY